MNICARVQAPLEEARYAKLPCVPRSSDVATHYAAAQRIHCHKWRCCWWWWCGRCWACWKNTVPRCVVRRRPLLPSSGTGSAMLAVLKAAAGSKQQRYHPLRCADTEAHESRRWMGGSPTAPRQAGAARLNVLQDQVQEPCCGLVLMRARQAARARACTLTCVLPVLEVRPAQLQYRLPRAAMLRDAAVPDFELRERILVHTVSYRRYAGS
jgi:hypothetical protein